MMCRNLHLSLPLQYLFSGMNPGEYQVQFSLPEEFIFTVRAKVNVLIEDPTNPDGSLLYRDVTSDVDRETGKTDVKTLNSGDENYSFDAGMFIPVTINGTSWHDLNADGIEEPNEPGLENMIITLYDRDGDEVHTRTTGPDGVWSFEDMPPGTYSVKITPPEDPSGNVWTLSPKPVSSTNSSTTDFDPETYETTPTFFESGSSSDGLMDAGLYLPATIGDYLWFDETPNGIQEPDEPAFDQPTTIKLRDELEYVVQEIESSESGQYQFTGVRPGTYVLEFILPGDQEYQFTLPNAGNDTSVDSDVSPVTGRVTVTVVSGEENLDIDAGIMDFGPYYPDWRNDVQVCTNDGFDPAWLEIQKDNYLYKNKEECCKTHFWWRMTQCMANEEFKFISNGEICETKIFFEDWEDNSPVAWTDTTQFDTLEECCATEFWFDFDDCVAESPVMFKFEFCFDVQGLVDPSDCQSADIYANVLEDSTNDGTHFFDADYDPSAQRGLLRALRQDGRRLHHGTDANITKIGDVSLTKVDGSTVCGGSLGGQGFINEFTGTIPDVQSANTKISQICGVITVKEQTCTEEACLREEFNAITEDLAQFITIGEMTMSINKNAYERLPPVPELQVITALPGSLVVSNLLLPATVTGDLDWKYYQGSDPDTCSEKVVFQPGETPYENLSECCNAHYQWDVTTCCIEGGGCPDLGIDAPDTWYFYAIGQGPDWCASKATLEHWEVADDFYPTREACCNAEAQAQDMEDCLDSNA